MISLFFLSYFQLLGGIPLKKRTFYALLVVLLLIVASLSVAVYAYNSFSNVVNPGKKPLAVKPVGAPYGGRLYRIDFESYLTGDPFVDLNMTLRSSYDKITIIVGNPSFKGCSGMDCALRKRTAMELGLMIGAIYGVRPYIENIQKGANNTSALYKAAYETMKNVKSDYLGVMQKIELGLGRIGNKKHLVIILLGPEEGATKNKVFCPRQGVLVIEGASEEALFVEVLTIKKLIGSAVK